MKNMHLSTKNDKNSEKCLALENSDAHKKKRRRRTWD